MYVIARPSVCRLSVTFVRPTQAIEPVGNVSTPFLIGIDLRWPSVDIQVKFYRDRPRGTPPSGEPNIAILGISNAISRKRCKIGAKLVLITNRKSHMSFPLVPKSVSLDDLERRNSPNRSVISPNSVTFGADQLCSLKVVEDTPILSAAVMNWPKNLVYSDRPISFMAILTENHPL